MHHALLQAVVCIASAPSFLLGTIPVDGEIHSTGGGGAWSDPATWTRVSGSGTTPGAGDLVVIAQGSPVDLDANSGIGDLGHLDIQDVLIFLDGTDYQLGASRIDVGSNGTGVLGAALHIGSASRPYQSRVTITLTEDYLSSTYAQPLSADENMTFAVHAGGRLELHGRKTDVLMKGGNAAPIPSWIRLADGHGVPVGGSTLMLESRPLEWRRRDKIVIASTDYDMNQAEVMTIVSIDGSTLHVKTPAVMSHHGVIESGLVDERAEVALLTRNIVIQGDDTTATPGFRGGHMMFMNAEGTLPIPIIHIEGVELRTMGWRGRLARYPIHFHKLGSAAGNYVRSSSIHGCFNRALTIHGTHDVAVKDVVAYDSWGHLFYLEDGVEVGNTFERNLGLVTKRPTHPESGKLLGDTYTVTGQPYFSASDDTPATYWISNTDNTFVGNVAAGSEAHGIWYAVGSGSVAVLPVRFSGNVAHSNGLNGFHQDEARMITIDPGQPNLVSQLDQSSDFLDFTAYKNRKSAVWHRSFGISRWVNARVADNQLGFYLAAEGFQVDHQKWVVSEDEPYDEPPFTDDPFNQPAFDHTLTGAPGMSFQTMESCVVIGESGNVGNPTLDIETAWPGGGRSLPDPANPQRILKGLELYDGILHVEDTQFLHFHDVVLPPTPQWPTGTVAAPGGAFDYRASAAITSATYPSVNVPGNPWAVDPRNAVRTTTFVDVDHPVLFPIPHAGFDLLFPAGYFPLFPDDIWLGFGPNGVASSMIFDVDGSVPGRGSGANTYVVNNTPLLRPKGVPGPVPDPIATQYAEPLFVPGPGSTGTHEAYGQLEIRFEQIVLTLPHIRFEAVHRPGTVVDVYSPYASLQIPITLLLENPDTDATSPGVEHYRLSYPTAPPVNHDPADDPRDLEVVLQFSEPGRSLLLEFPYDGGSGEPASVESGSGRTPGVRTLLVPADSLAEVEAEDGDGYYYDETVKRLYLKPTLQEQTGTALHPIYQGREVTLFVSG